LAQVWLKRIAKIWRYLGAQKGADLLWTQQARQARNPSMALSLGSMSPTDPSFYQTWSQVQEESDQRTPEEIQSIERIVMPLLHEIPGNCSICLGNGVVLKELPCPGKHAYCQQCLLRSWGHVGPIRCLECRMDVQQCLMGSSGDSGGQPAAADQEEPTSNTSHHAGSHGQPDGALGAAQPVSDETLRTASGVAAVGDPAQLTENGLQPARSEKDVHKTLTKAQAYKYRAELAEGRTLQGDKPLTDEMREQREQYLKAYTGKTRAYKREATEKIQKSQEALDVHAMESIAFHQTIKEDLGIDFVHRKGRADLIRFCTA